MISIRVEKRCGEATVRFRVTAPSIERALEIAGEDARVLFPALGIGDLRAFARTGQLGFPTTK